MSDVDVQRLAALDMWGSRGTLRRRRVILAEFTLGFLAAVTFGAWLMAASGGGGRVFGAWLVGAGINYAPLAWFAIVLSRPGVLDSELAGVDTGRELRRYGLLQLWIVVPLALVLFAAQNDFQRRRGRR